MLTSLHIQHYALIENLDINFKKGFSVITGETGAGKSIILGAIGLLLGQRADVKLIRSGAKKSVIEARFDISNYKMQSFFKENDLDYDDETILRREVYASGKSRAFVNDTPVSLSQIKKLGEVLIDVHSQHKNLLLNKEGFQLEVLDIMAQNALLLNDYQKVYNTWKQQTLQLDELIKKAEQSRSEQDYIAFQLEQLQEASLEENEQVALEEEYKMLSHAEEIKAALYKVEQLFSSDEGGLLSLFKEANNTLSNVLSIYPSLEDLSNRMESSYIEVKDVFDELTNKSEQVEYNPERLEEVNNRLNVIYSLEQKHHVKSVGELITLADEYAQQLDDITSYDMLIKELEIELSETSELLKVKADELTATRKKSAEKIERELVQRLLPLGMPNVCFKVEITPKENCGKLGKDSVNFLFSANKNMPLQKISSVASGGEIARVMLCLKAMIAGAVKLPTIIFDEIDTGVSGEIADKMADIMSEMGNNNRQVISITHLPQIAARGLVHYKVYKEDNELSTISYIRKLNEQQRIEEIAYMLSGAELTEAALGNAKVLLKGVL